MRPLFAPAIALMNRLGYTSKFAMLWLMSLIAVVVVVYNLYASLDKEIRSSQRELQGIALAKPISRAVQVIQQHRGLSASLLEGNEGMRYRRAVKEKDVGDAISSLEKNLPYNLRTSKEWQSIKANWTRLRQDGLGWTMDENFDAHTYLIDQLLFFNVTVSGEYILPLDPQIDTSYLIDVAIYRLPLSLEYLGQTRAYGSVILSKKYATAPEKVRINTLAAKLGDEIKFLKINLDKASSYNPSLRPVLSLASQDIATLEQRIVALVKSEIVAGHFDMSAEDFFVLTTEAIDKGYAQMHESLLPTIKTLIEARIAHAENALHMSIGIAFLLFLAAVYLSIGIYYATIGNIQLLARSARAFAGGDLRQRLELGTRDELKQIGDSFNEMADGFNRLLETHRKDESRLSAIIETAMDAVVQMNEAGIIIGWNTQAAHMFGWSREEAIGQLLYELIIPPGYREAHINGMRHFVASGSGPVLNSRIEVKGLHRDGHEFPVELSITAIKTADKYEFNGFIRDITQRRAAEELIWKQANHDPLTGLPNRRMFRDQLEQDIKKAHRAGKTMALLFIDLDRFKEVNDTLGHSFGDLLLVEAAHRINACTRESDMLAHLSGDEFIVLLTELDSTASVERVAGNILRVLADPFKLGSETIYLTASVGITLYPADDTEIEGLLKDAEQAMYVSKNRGRNRFSYFTPALQEAAQERMRLTNDLRYALAAGQLRVYYQPIVELATGRIHKAEALIRWLHPVRGLVSPAAFIPLSEENGLIFEIGDWIFKEAARQVKHWRATHDPAFQISVNMSPVQFRKNGSPCEAWPVYLRETALPGKSMVIEITEGLLLEAEAGVIDKLRKFHDSGIQISLDDFGTGYSSLSYLQKFTIDYLKIDQSFTRNLAPGSTDMALSEAIIVMAHKLGLEVIAEGVETEEQRTLLAAAGCNYAQGYLFSAPISVEEFEAYLRNSTAKS